MNTKILDCTLRDGGYVNDFACGSYQLGKLISQLTAANIDIIECGFLEDCEYDPSCSVFNRVEQIAPLLPHDRTNTIYVAMACYGEYDLSQLSNNEGTSINGIRVSFHYNEIEDAIEYCREIIKKGYYLFVQPIGTSSYSDELLIDLIKQVNSIHPYAFYFVDTLGLMHQDDVLRLYYLIDHNLDNNINMGFHSHNNLLLSYSNCQSLINLSSERTMIIDSSVYGMGRGAGNLNTELITHYLNIHQSGRYEIDHILEAVDEIILPIKQSFEWGYTVPFYLAAINGCHPNYASYLTGKQTLNIKSISTILRMIEREKRSLFDKSVAEQKYLEFQKREIDDSVTIMALHKVFSKRNVLIIAPGASINDNIDRLKGIIKQFNCVTVSVSFVPDELDCDYAFLSNSKRYYGTFNPNKVRIRLIYTSNIDINDDSIEKFIVNYSSLLCDIDPIMDNSSIMLLELLKKLEVGKVFLAGMDGYTSDPSSNYCQSILNLEQDFDSITKLNKAMKTKIVDFRRTMDIIFITPSLYIS